MNVSDYMEKYGLSDADLDRMAEPYENGDFEHEAGRIHTGSHVSAVGKKRITVVYDARTVQEIDRIAKSRGVKPSAVYRDAVDQYLAVHEA